MSELRISTTRPEGPPWFLTCNRCEWKSKAMFSEDQITRHSENHRLVRHEDSFDGKDNVKTTFDRWAELDRERERNGGNW